MPMIRTDHGNDPIGDQSISRKAGHLPGASTRSLRGGTDTAGGTPSAGPPEPVVWANVGMSTRSGAVATAASRVRVHP